VRVCFVTSEIFAFGVYGGFGKLTRDLANGLIEKNVEVIVLTRTLSKEQRAIEILDGKLPVIKLPRVISRIGSILPFSKTKLLYKLPDGDIYHSEAALIDGWLAMKHNPKKKHIITFQDPRTFEEHWKVKCLELEKPALYKKLDFKFRRKVFEIFEKRAVKNADRLYCQAKYIIPKVMKMYDIPVNKTPEFLPNPVKLPNRPIKKSSEPTVCFLGRWDAQKRPEIFLQLTKKFPEVHFIIIGNKETSYAKQRKLYEKLKEQPNLTITGLITEAEKSNILEKSWALVNTSIRECLPVSFIEALGHETPIISAENPDGLVSNYGIHVGYNFEDYVSGLEKLMKMDWRKLGKSGRAFVEKTFEYNKVIDQHIKIYKEVLSC